MSTKYLGQPFDIHGGGVENKFPHHESEIAQAEAATGEPFARYWLHNGMLMIRGEEMHKSLGNFITLQGAFAQWDPLAIRFFILLSHYRGPLDLTEEALDAAGKGLARLTAAARAVRRRLEGAPQGEPSDEVAQLVEATRARFEESMDDDFNTAGGIAALFDATREVNAMLAGDAVLTRGSLEALDTLYRRLLGDVLGVLPENLEEEGTEGLAARLIDLLIDMRAELRKSKQYAQADAIRDRLAAMGVQLMDGPEGTTWSLT